MSELSLAIDNTLVNVTWEDNPSVSSLRELASSGLTLNLTRYGGFEQVGPIGKTLPSSDVNLTTSPGDICLYDSNKIVLFFGKNTWAYTRLGHINLSKDELATLLNKESVTITLR